MHTTLKMHTHTKWSVCNVIITFVVDSGCMFSGQMNQYLLYDIKNY